MRRIIVAPDSFKECLNATSIADAIAAGFQRVFPDLDIKKIPMSDGGEGLVETLVTSTKGQLMTNVVTGPCGDPVAAVWGILGDGKTCVIEMAAASGLPLVPSDKRNPLYTTTYGTGELIKHALATGCTRIIVGIGGSATNDGGAGMAQALGFGLFDDNGDDIGFGAAGVSALARIDVSNMDARLRNVEIIVAMDVNNPLCGATGASFVYGPQKGATPEMLPQLDNALLRYSKLIHRDIDVDIVNVPGSGAAGGLGAGLLAFLGAQPRSGIEVVLEVVQFEKILQQGVDLVVTGEGEINKQTTYGKVPVGVAKIAKKYHVPVIALVGSIGVGAAEVLDHGIDAFFSLIPRPMNLAESINGTEKLLADLAEQCARLAQATAVRTKAFEQISCDNVI